MSIISDISDNYKDTYKKVISYDYPDYREIVIINATGGGTSGGRKVGTETTEKSRAINVKRIRKNVKRYALANRLYTHLTLTFANNITDLDYADNEFKNFIKRLEYAMKKNIKYVATKEFQERGAVHYHVLIDSPIWGTQFQNYKKADKYKNKNGNIPAWQGINIISDIWGLGFCKIVEHGNNLKAINYIIKYIVKSVEDTAKTSKKAYLNSNDLKEGIDNMKKAIVFTNFTGQELHNKAQQEKFEYMLDILIGQATPIYNWTSPPDEDIKVTAILINKEERQ